MNAIYQLNSCSLQFQKNRIEEKIMKKLKSMIVKALNRDVLDIYKHLDPSTDDFSMAIHLCESLSLSKKNSLSENLSKKMQKQHDNRECLNLLILCDFLSATKPQILGAYPESMEKLIESRKKIGGNLKEDKIRLAETNFLGFYLEYLKQKIWNNMNIDSLNLHEIDKSVDYCISSLSALKLVIRYDFIIEYVLAHSELSKQIKIVLQNVLRRSKQDLQFIIRFVDKWVSLIIQDHPHSIKINEVYEQLLFVNKNIAKFEFLRLKVATNIKFPRYQFDKNLNSNIEKCMILRDSERKHYNMTKRLKTQGDHLSEDFAEITQSQIYVKMKL